METKIKCRSCGREMGFWEFVPYIENYLIKLAVETGLAALLVTALKDHFLTRQETRGFINEQMVTYAHLLAIKCPKCKELDVWDPVFEEDVTSGTKIETSTKNINKDPLL